MPWQMMSIFKDVKVRGSLLSPNETDYTRHFELAVLGRRINKGGAGLRLNKQSLGRCPQGSVFCIKLKGPLCRIVLTRVSCGHTVHENPSFVTS